MTLPEKYLIGKIFSVLVIVKNEITDHDISKCYYRNCYTVTEEQTGYIGIRNQGDKTNQLYITYERLRYSDHVYFDETNQMLEIIFKA